MEKYIPTVETILTWVAIGLFAAYPIAVVVNAYNDAPYTLGVGE